MSTAVANRISESPGNGLIHSSGGAISSGSSAYDRVADPLAFVSAMGKVFAKAGACGVSTEAEGELLALACICEKKHAFEIGRRFHIMDGKLVLKSDVMLADFNAAGGAHRWVKDGSDGVEAQLWLRRPDGEEMTSSYSIADAQAANLVRDKSNWTKGPKAVGQMLRARATSNGIRMLMPAIVAGVYSPEEIADEMEFRQPAKPTRSTAEVERRREELQALEATQTQAAQPVQQSHQVVDAEVTAVAPKAEEPPLEAPAQAAASTTETTKPTAESSEHTAVLMDIEATSSQLGLTKEQLEASIRAKSAEFTTLDSLPLDKAKALLNNLRASIAKK